MNKTENLTSLFNEQIKKEFEAAYLYLGFASFFEQKGLSGFSNWYKKQALEEKDHALKIYDFLCSINESVELLPIDSPKIKTQSIAQILDQGLKHEQHITSLINNLCFQAQKEKNLFAMSFLQWFINEQLEEEENARELISRYELFCTSPEGLYFLDKELGTR